MPTSISAVFSDPSCFFLDQNPPSLQRDTGAQSGNETQFVFSEGDIYQRDGDVIRRQATGELILPRSIKLL